MSACLLVLAKLFNCSHARFFVKIPCRVRSLSIICILETKTDTGNSFPYGKLGSIEEICAGHDCFWKNASSFCWRLLNLSDLSSVPRSRVTLPWSISLVKAGFNPLNWEGTYLLVNGALESYRYRLASTPLTLVKLSEVTLQLMEH